MFQCLNFNLSLSTSRDEFLSSCWCWGRDQKSNNGPARIHRSIASSRCLSPCFSLQLLFFVLYSYPVTLRGPVHGVCLNVCAFAAVGDLNVTTSSRQIDLDFSGRTVNIHDGQVCLMEKMIHNHDINVLSRLDVLLVTFSFFFAKAKKQFPSLKKCFWKSKEFDCRLSSPASKLGLNDCVMFLWQMSEKIRWSQQSDNVSKGRFEGEFLVHASSSWLLTFLFFFFQHSLFPITMASCCPWCEEFKPYFLTHATLSVGAAPLCFEFFQTLSVLHLTLGPIYRPSRPIHLNGGGGGGGGWGGGGWYDVLRLPKCMFGSEPIYRVCSGWLWLQLVIGLMYFLWSICVHRARIWQ